MGNHGALREKEKMETTAAVTDLATNSRYEDLPAEAIHEAKRALLDSIGVALVGLSAEKGIISVKLAKRLGGASEATIIGAGKASTSSAAYANGELINALDWDATCPSGHITPYVLPASLALGEYKNASGKQLILSIALGHEIAIRIGRSLGNQRKIIESHGKAKPVFSPVYGFGFNAIPAAIVAAKMLGLNRAKIGDAIGIAGYMVPVPSMVKWYRTTPVPMSKYCSAGWVAQAGVTAAVLAEAGYVGDSSVLDGPWGFWRMFGVGRKWNPEPITKDTGKVWYFSDEMNYKVYPCCGLMQLGLELFSKIIHEEKLAPEEIEEIRIFSDPWIQKPIWANTSIKTHVDAQFSVAYGFAALAHRIRLTDWQLDNTIRRPELLKFMEKVKIKTRPNYFQVFLAKAGAKDRPVGGGAPTTVEVVARGTVFKNEGTVAKGRSMPLSCRLTDAELVSKFMDNADMVLSRDAKEKLVEDIFRLEKIEDISTLLSGIICD